MRKLGLLSPIRRGITFRKAGVGGGGSFPLNVPKEVIRRKLHLIIIRLRDQLKFNTEFHQSFEHLDKNTHFVCIKSGEEFRNSKDGMLFCIHLLS